MLASSISAEEFGRLFLRFKDKFISRACSFTRDRAAAEDIVTESFTAFWNGREHIELKSLPEAYVLQSVRNRCLNYMRNKAVRMRIEGDINSVSARAVEMEADILSEESISFLFRDEVQEIFMNFMKTMPDLTRKIFLASRMEGLTYNEIAERYGVTPRKVKRDIQKVLEIMRISLKDYLPVLLLVFPGLFRI